jgi:small subunit ribosomal protein S4e
MVKKGGNKKTKRSKAPAFWTIRRKDSQFIVSTLPGPHPKEMSYPLAVFLRDILGFVKTYREAKFVINEGRIKIDGIIRKEANYPVGLMDVIEIPIIDKIYRLVPTRLNPLSPIEISEKEKSMKICRVKVKKVVKKGKIQYGLHDSRSIFFDDAKLKIGDSCLIEVPSQKFVNSIKLEEGTLVIITRGEKVGQIGTIKQIIQGNFTRQKMFNVLLDEISTQLPSDIVFPIGMQNPLITIG